jgi:hypothetical protein
LSIGEYARSPLQQRRPIRRQPNDQNFVSLIMLAVTAGAFLVMTWVATKGPSFRSRQFVERRRGNFSVGGYASAGLEEQASLLLLTEHFSYDEDEYRSAKAAAQKQIQQGIACCG